MTRIEPAPWQAMVSHAREVYPDECCGAMLGRVEGDTKLVTEALRMENAYEGPRRARYELRPEDLITVERLARELGLTVIGIYHSHPDCDAYFSQTDLKNSCPWYSFVVLSIRQGEFDHANSWLPDADQTHADREPLEHPAAARTRGAASAELAEP